MNAIAENINKILAKLPGNRRQQTIIGGALLALVLIFAVAIVRAGSPFISIQAEDATLAQLAQVKSDAEASGGQAVMFGNAVTTPTDPNPTPSTGSFHSFGTATVTADFNSVGAGSNVDSMAFWDAPDPNNSMMFVTSKNVSLVEVWKYPYTTESPALKHSCLAATSNSKTNGIVIDQEADLLYVASNYSPNVCVFSLPSLAHVKTITSGATYGLEPNLALIKLSNGTKRLYVSNNNIVYVHDATTGQKVSQFTPAKGLEAMWGDSYDQVLYIPDENGRTGVYAYKPDGTAYTRDGKNFFGNSTIFNSDEEGILEFTCPASGSSDNGAGIIVVSDQVDSASAGNDYEVFDRRTWAHLGKIKMRLPGGTGYVYNTDGIATTQQSSTRYAGGVFLALQNDTSVVGVSWNKVLAAISAQSGKSFGCGS